MNKGYNIDFTEYAIQPLTPRVTAQTFLNIEQETKNKEFRSLTNNGDSDDSKLFVKLRNPLFLIPCSIFKTLPILFLFLFSTCTSPTLSPKEKLLHDSVNFLWKKQNIDGGWHSETHGILRSGQSISAFVFHQLLQVPKEIYQPTNEQINNALTFIRTHCKNGILGHFNPIILDYPNYATAYALRILKHFDKAEDQVLIQEMQSYLLSQQFIEQRGFTSEHPAYGAWGFGEKFLEEGQHGHVDLSHTRRILQTLQLIDNQQDSVFFKSQQFLSLLQKKTTDSRLHPTGIPNQKVKYDGGFYASTVTVSTNKGDITNEENSYYRSYATATADGLLALIATGLSHEDQQVQDAFQWLLKHPKLEYPEGIPQDDPSQWHRVMFYYHLSVRAQAYHAMNHTGDWENKMVNILLEKQNKDGSFSNPMGAPNKEDDPLIATALVVAGLAGK